MTIPIKLNDLGSGIGRLVEFASTDMVSLNNLPIQDTLVDITPNKLLVTGAYGLGVNAAVYEGNIDVVSSVPRGRVYCTGTTTGTKPTALGILHTEKNTSDYIHQEWIELTGSATTLRRFWRDGYGTVFGAWQQYSTSSSSVGPWANLSTYFAPGTIPVFNTPQFRFNGDRVEFRGGIGKSGGFGGAANPLLTMPTGARPTYATGGIQIPQVTYNTAGVDVLGALTVDSTGFMNFSITGGGLNGSGISLEPLSYTILS